MKGGILMKKLTDQLKAIAKSLASLSKQVERVSKQAAILPSPKKVASKKKVRKKPFSKKKIAKKVAAKKKVAKKTKAVKKKTAATTTVLDAVMAVVKRSKKGATIDALRSKTGLGPRQLSNALYKLSKKGVIVAKSRGVYVKK